MSATWQPNPFNPDDVISLVEEDGSLLAYVEDFGYACYPTAWNAATRNLERGGAYFDRVEALLWCERVAGLHPVKPGDERPAFYYDPEKK